MKLNLSDATETILVVVLSLISALAILGNGIVIFTFLAKTNLRKIRSNTFILSLAITDLLCGLITMPLNIDFLRNDQTWLHGEALCITWLLSDTVLCTTSIWNLVAIAADRLLAVVFPVFYMNLRHKSVFVALIGVWSLSVAICLPQFFLRNIRFKTCVFWSGPFYDLLTPLLVFFVPLAVITICYSVIALRVYVKMRRKALHKKSMDLELKLMKAKNENLTQRCGAPSAASSTYLIAAVTTVTGVDASPGSRSPSPRPPVSWAVQRPKPNNKRDKRVLLQTSVLVLAFVLCWLPFWTFFTTLSVCMRKQTCSYQSWFPVCSLVFQWLGYSNSVINPILYSVFNPDFRQAFSQVLCQRSNRRI